MQGQWRVAAKLLLFFEGQALPPPVERGRRRWGVGGDSGNAAEGARVRAGVLPAQQISAAA